MTMEGFCYYRPYVDPIVESLIEDINPPRVCIDNDACKHCTLIKVDSANKHGILLQVVQILTDLDLVISKSYICSDGGWFMDVFHVTDQFGKKITDESLLDCIQQAICTRSSNKKQVHQGKEMRPQHLVMEHTALEITMTDQPGLLSKVSAMLAELGCHVKAAVAWTHRNRGAIILYVHDQEMGQPITDVGRLAHIQEQLQTVVEAHHKKGERQSVRLTSPAATRTHTERRLHQMMVADEDYKTCCSCGGSVDWEKVNDRMSCECTHVSIYSCKEKGYSVINIRCRDRPKLLFDTVCALTDMQYTIFHAAISSKSCIAAQEYYVRRKDGCILDTETERQKVTQCLIAAVERRGTQGMRLDITALDRLGLLSDISRVFREYGLSILRAEISTKGEEAIGTFYVTDASGQEISTETLDAVKGGIDGNVKVYDKLLDNLSTKSKSVTKKSSREMEDRLSLQSLGSSLWSRLEQMSGSFGAIMS